MQLKLIVSIVVGVLLALTIALAMHTLGLDSPGLALLPILAGLGAGRYVFIKGVS